MNDNNLNLTDFLYRKASLGGVPLGGTFELTPRCNLKCRMCYVRLEEDEMKKVGKLLSVEQWLDIAKAAKDEGMLYLLLTGGEPLMYPGFIELYTELKKMGFLISINTNGSLFKDEILKTIVENPPYKVNITLYGASDETYNELCGVNGVFDRVINTIKTLKTSGVFVKLNASITNQNCNDIEKLYEIAKRIDVPIEASSYMFPPERRKDFSCQKCERMTAEEAGYYQAVIDRLKLTKEQYEKKKSDLKSGNVRLSNGEDDCADVTDNRFRCRAGRSSFWMTWFGKMNACGMINTPSSSPLKIGFKSAWEEIKNSIKSCEAMNGCCNCENKMICHVCPAMCLAETGDLNGKPDYICNMVKSWKENM